MKPHPLSKFFLAERSSPRDEDKTREDFRLNKPVWQRGKRAIGARLYPLKNHAQRSWVEKQMKCVGCIWPEQRPNIISWGHKGFGYEIFLRHLARFLPQRSMVLCIGCGEGSELLTLAKTLKPKHVIGVDYFDHTKAWRQVAAELARTGIACDFKQADLRKPLDSLTEQVDAIFSETVLEHLEDMELIFRNICDCLKPDGLFAAQWGPMWHSYTGDHIAAELGFDSGFEHLRLTADEYFAWYCAHPRNASTVARGKPTWLTLGLVNFMRYEEYLKVITDVFGPTLWLQWVVRPEAFRFRREHGGKWQEVLKQNPQIQPLDLVLGSAGVVARRTAASCVQTAP